MPRRAGIFATVLILAACQPPAPAVAPGPIPAAIQTDVSFIGSERQEGRAVGSAGSNRVASYIVQLYKQLALPGAFPAQCSPAQPPCDASYFQPFSRQNARNAKNIGVVINGSDAAVRNQYIVIGAHYDHIGRSQTLSLDEERADSIRPGADDNASGTAAIMELARRLAARPPRRSIMIVHFDAEEVGLYGSEFFVDAPPVPRRQMKFMLNLDMVGRLSAGKFSADTTSLIFPDVRVISVLDSASRSLGIRIAYINDINGRSDHASFRRVDVPSIALFTGFHSDYHRATDVVSKLDVRGIGRIADIAEALVRFEADRR
ncbi:MAG: M28 family peptidase [Gemmatimonadaceae bacterium]